MYTPENYGTSPVIRDHTVFVTCQPTQVKVKVWVLAIALFTWKDSWTAALYNLESGSWLVNVPCLSPSRKGLVLD